MKSLILVLAALCLCSALRAEPVYVLDLSPMALRGAGTLREAQTLWDTLLLASSVQGIVNRTSPDVYVIFTGTEASEDGSVDRFWLSRLQEGFIKGRPLKPVGDVWSLVRLYRNRIKGLAVYDPAVPATANAAVTAAGCDDLLPVRYDTSPGSAYLRLTEDLKLPVKARLVNPDGSSRFTGSGLIPDTRIPSSGSAKCDAYLWAKAKYLDTGKCDPSQLGYYIDAAWIESPWGRPSNCCLGNRDYIISRRGFCLDLSPWEDEAPGDDPGQKPGTDARTFGEILAACAKRLGGKKLTCVSGYLPWDKKYSDAAGGKHGVVEGEWALAGLLSSFNAYLDADAVNYPGMCNASFFALEPLKKRYPQNRPEPAVKPEHKCYICFYAGDYDSAAWMYQNLPRIWNDPARGSEPMCWGFDPNLAERFATGFNYLRGTATPQDCFVGGDSGAGYLNPGFLSEPRPSGLPSAAALWKKHCSYWYRRFDLSITGFLLEGNAPPMSPELWDALAEFSPDGAAGMYMPESGLYKDMPFVVNRFDEIRFDKSQKERYIRNLVKLSRGKKPCFILARHILWTPSEQKEFMEALSREGDFVRTDIYTFMALVREFYRSGMEFTPSDNRFDCGRITVGDHSPLFEGCDPRDAFGGAFGTAEKGALLFRDTGEDEYFLEWSAPDAADIRTVEIELQADGDTGERQAAQVTLEAFWGEERRTLLSAETGDYDSLTLEEKADAAGADRFRLTLRKKPGCRLAPRIKNISARP
ncbi:MAG: hypothetical protein IJT95_06930 [Abditibacteriota bacterium]|nr:hypothetical protein [Abditibacteriota bacterium]